MFIFDEDYRENPNEKTTCPYCRHRNNHKDRYSFSICFYCSDKRVVKTEKLRFHQDFWLKTQQISQNMQHIPFEQFRKQYFEKMKKMRAQSS